MLLLQLCFQVSLIKSQERWERNHLWSQKQNAETTYCVGFFPCQIAINSCWALMSAASSRVSFIYAAQYHQSQFPQGALVSLLHMSHNLSFEPGFGKKKKTPSNKIKKHLFLLYNICMAGSNNFLWCLLRRGVHMYQQTHLFSCRKIHKMNRVHQTLSKAKNMWNVAHLLTERMNVAHKEDKDIYQGRGWAERSGQEEWVGRIGWRCGGLEGGGNAWKDTDK